MLIFEWQRDRILSAIMTTVKSVSLSFQTPRQKISTTFCYVLFSRKLQACSQSCVNSLANKGHVYSVLMQMVPVPAIRSISKTVI